MRRACRRAKVKVPPGNELVELIQAYYDVKVPSPMEVGFSHPIIVF